MDDVLIKIKSNPFKVRTVPVETRALPLDQLKARAPKVEEISSVEASLRLDALASAGKCFLCYVDCSNI